MAIAQAQLAATDTILVTVPADKSYAITTIMVCNTAGYNSSGTNDTSFDLHFVNTICFPTKRNHEQIIDIAKDHDVMIIIGSYTSANSKRLRKLASIISDQLNINKEDPLIKPLIDEVMNFAKLYVNIFEKINGTGSIHPQMIDNNSDFNYTC